MKKSLYTLMLLIFIAFQAIAQHSIQSTVYDSKNGLPLEIATVRLLNHPDSSFVQGTVTDVKGGFTLPKVKSGNYIIVVSSIGYISQNRNITVEKKDMILKSFQLTEDVKLLSEVGVKGTAAQMVVKGDTLEYNATAFKTAENSAVEELLKKLPGVEITAEGKITVNGEEVKKIRLDGKKFFDGDIEQATKNLPADMIEKIQVLEQKSDMALLTGFEDGETERVINLTTKSNRKKGFFGNINGGIGADINKDIRYDNNLSLNIMDGDIQTSINAGANNLNMARGSRGRGSWGGGASGGISTSQNIGLNNNTIINSSFKVGGDITANHVNNLSDTKSNQTSYLLETTYTDNSKNVSENDKYEANARFELEWKIDSSRTLVVQPRFNFSTTDSYSLREYSYLTEDDSTSWGNTNNEGVSSSISGGLNLIYSRKFESKAGRTLTTRLGADFSQSDNESYNSSNKFTPDSVTRIDQFSNNGSDKFNASLKLSFVEPLWNEKNLLEIALSASNTTTTSDKKQFSKDLNDKYTIFDSEYSNNFENEFFSESLELNYRYTEKNYNILLGLNGEPSQTKNIRTYGNGITRDTTYGVFNLAPTARFQYNMGKKQFARIDYRGRTTQPSINQMQPVKNNNDLMSETVGNPLLNPSFSHSLRLMYSTFDEIKFSSFNTFFNIQGVKDALVSNKIYDNTLKQYNQTINSKAIPLSLIWNVMYNTPLIQKRLHFNTNTNVGYRSQYGYIKRDVNVTDIDIDNLPLGDLSKTRTYNASEAISLTFTHDVFELGIRGNISYTNSLNNLKNIPTETWNWSGTGNIVIRFPYNFVLSSDIAYSDRAGYTNMDQSEIMWNASIDKTLFKNQATLSLRANDILRQRLNIRQTVGDNYVQNSSYNTLPSYFLLTFTYKINKFGGKKGEEGKQPNFNRFGPGMMPPGGMMPGGFGGGASHDHGGGMF